MTRTIALAVALAAVPASGAAVHAQPVPQPPAAQLPPLPPPPGTPASEEGVVSLVLPGTPASELDVNLSVEVTIFRYQGGELVSSLPYVLSLTPDLAPASLRMEAEVPVLNRRQPPGPDGEPSPAGPFIYRPVGTHMESFARSAGGGRYRVTVIIEESSVYGEEETSMEAVRAQGVPVFRSFESRNTLILRDGQSRQYTAAADRVTGESIRVDVMLTVNQGEEPAP